MATGLPRNQAQEINLDPNTAAGKFELAINQANIKPGVYTFYMRADTSDTSTQKLRRPRSRAKVLDEAIKALGEVVKTATAKDAATRKQ